MANDIPKRPKKKAGQGHHNTKETSSCSILNSLKNMGYDLEFKIHPTPLPTWKTNPLS